jgi:hypothetical protein
MGKTYRIIPAQVFDFNTLLERMLIMDFGIISKVLFFALWPLLILLIVYLLDRKNFKSKWERLKQTGFFSK